MVSRTTTNSGNVLLGSVVGKGTMKSTEHRFNFLIPIKLKNELVEFCKQKRVPVAVWLRALIERSLNGTVVVSSRKQWEYTKLPAHVFVRNNSISVDELNNYGRQGWELTYVSMVGGKPAFFYFKREI